MKKANKKEANLTVMLDFALLDKTFGALKNSNADFLQDYPQVEFLNLFNFHSPLLGIFLSKEEYEAYIKPSLSFGDLRNQEKTEIDFESFLQLLLNKEGDKKNFLLRSSFLERMKEENALLIKEIFNICGFNIKIKIIIENTLELLIKDFSSLFYQIPTGFRFSKIESFFQSLFKNKILNSINGINILLDVFGNDNVSFIYNEEIPHKNNFHKLCESLGLNPPAENTSLIFNEINPLFMDYMKSKLNSGQDKYIDIRKEAKVIKKITDRYNLKNFNPIKNLSSESIDTLFELNQKLINFLSDQELPIKKNFLIKSETCNLRHSIPYIDNI
jgi:hypothetical protein